MNVNFVIPSNIEINPVSINCLELNDSFTITCSDKESKIRILKALL